MDEPESGLDQSAIALMREVVLATKAGGGAVLLVTHNFEQALELGDRLAILGRGRVAHEETLGPDGGTSPEALQDIYSRYAGERTPGTQGPSR